MRAKPFLQVLSWLSGVAAGGAFTFLTITPGRVSGATRASRLQWQQRHNGPQQSALATEEQNVGRASMPFSEAGETLVQKGATERSTARP
jgi:hypothetical protein